MNNNSNNSNRENGVDYYIYFDGKQMGGFIATSCVILDRNKSVKPVASATDTEPSTDGNQFSAVLKSIITAVKCARDNNLNGRVVFLNQNNTVINWLLSGRCNDSYAGLFGEAVEMLSSLQFQCNLFIQPVDPKDNRAKKLLTKVKAPKDQSVGMSRLVFNTPGQSNYGGDRFISQNDDDDFFSNPVTELSSYRKAVNS